MRTGSSVSPLGAPEYPAGRSLTRALAAHDRALVHAAPEGGVASTELVPVQPDFHTKKAVVPLRVGLFSQNKLLLAKVVY